MPIPAPPTERGATSPPRPASCNARNGSSGQFPESVCVASGAATDVATSVARETASAMLIGGPIIGRP
jgi:hypothetical protein